jgi:LmbE family N-acetylglucosaminyl deacetylase
MPSKMPLYHPEQLNEPGSGLGQLQQIFFFATDRDPDVFVDITEIYESKVAACLAHRSQFPRGLEDLKWLRELDSERGKVIGVPLAESFRQVNLW